MHVQAQLHGYEKGRSDELERDPQGKIKVAALFKKWTESGQVRCRLISQSCQIPLFDVHDKVYHGCQRPFCTL